MAKLIPIKGGFSLLNNVPEGACPECATRHDPQQPHNQQSLFYQYKFYAEHDEQWPTWADAMAHCTPEMKAYWTKALQDRKVDIGTVASTTKGKRDKRNRKAITPGTARHRGRRPAASKGIGGDLPAAGGRGAAAGPDARGGNPGTPE